MFKPTDKPAPTTAPSPSAPPWRVLVVDDEPEVHAITRLALSDCEYQGRPVEFLRAHSGAEARAILAGTPEVALAFVDVVMETDRAGLDLVTHIRQELGDKAMRIILRTGQPGMAPERTVIRDFDINDYLNKTQAPAGKLYNATLTALRAYSDITTLERSRQQLERYRDGLEKVITATSSLFEQRSLRLLASGLLHQIGGMLADGGPSMIVRTHGVTVASTGQGFEILARTGRFDHDGPLHEDALRRLGLALAERRSVVEDDVFVGYFPTQSGVANLLYLEGVRHATPVDLKLLDIFSKNISVAFDNLYLDREMLDTQSEIIATLGDIVETRSMEAGNHINRVRHLARLVAQTVGLDDAQCELIYLAAPMHDIGKVAIPDAILLKPGPLDADEWRVMQRHAQIGSEVFGQSVRPMMQAASIIAAQHHEKYDGSGYPLGLRGEEIHIFGRIVALVDVFDALIHKRCYKPAWPVERIVALLIEERGRHFDPALVDALLGRLDDALALVRRFPSAQPATPLAGPAAPSTSRGPACATPPEPPP